MQNAIKEEIKRLSKRAFRKQTRRVKDEVIYRRKFEKRTGTIAGVPATKQPPDYHKHFDPKHCARNANFLAKAIWRKILSREYEPVPAIKYLIPKPDGSKREIMAFPIPDAALANVVFRRTMDRNKRRLSPSSYAYHPEKNVFDAVLALRDFDYRGKLFAVQIDFKNYFDSIRTRYLTERLGDASKINLTPHERHIFDRFLHHEYAEPQNYKSGKFEKRRRGTPQGSSVSLLLANIASHDLDTALSAQPGKFVRYADDVVAVCSRYEDAQTLEKCFTDHCAKSGLKINEKKSPGIAIISKAKKEIRTYSHFDYLGYKFGPDGLDIPRRTVIKIKSKVSRLINIYLLQYLSEGFNPDRASITPPQYDWDLLGLTYEIKRYLYGGLSEHDLHQFIRHGTRLKKMRGLMGFYCLLENSDELRRLDGWLLSIVRRAMVKRNQKLTQDYGAVCPTPSNSELITGSWLDPAAWHGESPPELRMPSLIRGWQAARKHYYTFGLENVQAPKYLFQS